MTKYHLIWGSVQQTADTKFGYVASHILHVNNVELAKEICGCGERHGIWIYRPNGILLICTLEKLATMLNLFALPDYILLSCLTLIMIRCHF